MGEVVRFIPKAERERIRLMREARALYDSVFPPTKSVNAQRDKTPVTRPVNGARLHHGAELLS